MGTLFVECSAKTNVGVQDIFQDLVRKVRTIVCVKLTNRSWRDQNYGQEAHRRTRSSRYKRTRMIRKGGVAARLDSITLYVLKT